MKHTFLAFALLPICIFYASAQDTTPAKRPPGKTTQTKGTTHLSDVHRIFLADFTRSEHAETFRSLLSEKLTGKGFTIVKTFPISIASAVSNVLTIVKPLPVSFSESSERKVSACSLLVKSARKILCTSERCVVPLV